jgi:putative nucleotidyltransferase with HDIG domain
MQKQEQDAISELFPTIEKIQDKGIREKVISTLYKAWRSGNFKRIEDVHQFEPARDRIVYNNVDHTNQVCQACEKMAALLTEILNLRVNMDYLLAGALLHDVDKMVIFDARTGGLTEMGRKNSHAVTGGALAREQGLPEEVAHIIEAHSAKFSPAPPQTFEALILRHADPLVAQSVYLAQGLDMEKVLAESMARIA